MTPLDVAELAQQAANALAYYAVLVLMMRLAGKLHQSYRFGGGPRISEPNLPGSTALSPV